MSAWEWRRSDGPDWFDADNRFHACDVNNNLACAIAVGLDGSADTPNEGSNLCEACVATVKSMPEGRARREAQP